MFRNIIINCICISVIIASSAFASSVHDEHHLHDHSSRPDAHAPIGIMRSHVHAKGEVMLSYRYGFMDMDGNRNGSSSLSTQEVLDDYMVAPTEMQMQMHMFGVMYGLTDQFTLSAMGGFSAKEMDHLRRDGTTFLIDNDGITDTSINALYEFYNDGKHRVQFNAGISLPTGSYNERNSSNSMLAYTMQIGSGTYDLLPGISYSGETDDWSWGSQLNSIIRLGRNNRGYTLGNRYQLTGWGARKLNDMFSISLRLDGQAWGNIDGNDRELAGPTFMSPSMDSHLQAGERIDVLVGVNFLMPSGILEGNRLALEFGVPVYERLDGPRLETDYRLVLGWQYVF